MSGDRVDPLPVVTLHRFDSESHLLAERAGQKPTNAVSLPACCGGQILQRCSTLSPKQVEDLGLFTSGEGGLLIELVRRSSPRRSTFFLWIKALDCRPDSTGCRVPVRELFDWRNAGQSIPDFYQARAWPMVSKNGQL